MKHLLPSAIDFISNSANPLRIANLVVIELPSNGGSPQYAYYTDYGRDIVYNGTTYISGKIKSISSHKQNRKLTVGSLSITMSGVDNVELGRLVASGVSFIDRTVIIYQAFLDSNGEIVPTDSDTKGAYKYFSGKISSGNVRESNNGNTRSSVITWTCNNMFYDFERVNGRITDDASHRGLEVIDGKLVPTKSAKKIEYMDDLGFFHSNKSITILAKYQAKEKRYKLKSKSSFFGLSKKYSLVEYYENVTRSIDIDFNLTAKFIPVVYGVRQVPGIPVFADTDASDPETVWVVYAFAEGEIEGFLDFSFNDVPMICYDDADSKDRTCFGRKRYAGDTMHRLASGVATSSPSVHGQEYKYNDGNGDIRVWTYHGLSDQEASRVLVDKAKARGFLLQRNQGMGPEYWDENYKLLDTAYAVVRFKLTENRTEIPQVDATVLGRKVRTYSRDGTIKADRTTLNGIWQTVDYLTSTTFGANVSLELINMERAIDSAEIIDTIDESYDGAWVNYWRYLGWNNMSDSNRQMIQMNTVIDTAESVFKNVEVLLDGYSGSLNNMLGVYGITVEKYDPNPRKIHYLETNGSVELEDITGRNKFNSVQASIIDPALAWKSSTVTFYNSEFKRADNDVDKRLNLSFANITNYYTARSMAARELKKSRYNRVLKLELPISHLGIEVNDAVSFTYDRYKWKDKYFLVDEVEVSSSGKIKVSLREYGEDVFINSQQVENPEVPPIIEALVTPPRDLQYTPYKDNTSIGKNGTLSWLPSITPGIAYYTVYQTDRLDPYVVTSNVTSLNSRLELDLFGLTEGTYTFEVRAVDVTGRRSSPVVLTLNIDAARNLSVVTNFKLVNRAPGSFTDWIGPDVITEWDGIKEEKEITGLRYVFQFLHPQSLSIIYSSATTNGHRSIYQYAQNKSDYMKLNNALGVFREGVIRVRAEGPNGEASVAWTYLND
ncbi:tail protein [Providencia phage vB_PreS_PR1]|uniref:Tail protein n=1 Tax=Providencia phage vB_PreS_PR1 TaxID=1931407 RepID=A0A1S6KUW0_9CAUD|nr:central tail fiber J [Providencia phage vB_PreS_PR1]AQT25205.1 tail protein [Providencia phage vB_PreS_PR1]